MGARVYCLEPQGFLGLISSATTSQETQTTKRPRCMPLRHEALNIPSATKTTCQAPKRSKTLNLTCGSPERSPNLRPTENICSRGTSGVIHSLGTCTSLGDDLNISPGSRSLGLLISTWRITSRLSTLTLAHGRQLRGFTVGFRDT